MKCYSKRTRWWWWCWCCCCGFCSQIDPFMNWETLNIIFWTEKFYKWISYKRLLAIRLLSICAFIKWIENFRHFNKSTHNRRKPERRGYWNYRYPRLPSIIFTGYLITALESWTISIQLTRRGSLLPQVTQPISYNQWWNETKNLINAKQWYCIEKLSLFIVHLRHFHMYK